MTSASHRPGEELPLVSVVVVNFNGRDFLGDTLESLARQSYPKRETILVDNSSADGSVCWVRAHFPDVQIVVLEQNRGFAGGCNAGIRNARGDLIATLNNDAVADRTWLEELVKVLHDRPDVGMVASRLLRADLPSVVDSTGISIDRAGIAWDRRRGWPDGPEDVQEIFGPCAGAALYRRELFDDIGGFDEDFFCYMEDVDLAWRARLAGWRCLYAPRAFAYHRRSATAIEGSTFKRYHLGRNKLWLIVKNYPAPAIWWYLPAIVLYDLASVIRSVGRKGAGSHAGPASSVEVRARIDAWRGLGAMLEKRKAVQKRRRVPAWRVLFWMDGVSWPWQVAARYDRR